MESKLIMYSFIRFKKNPKAASSMCKLFEGNIKMK